MAALMSQLVISGFKEQVVELLVEGSKITSVKQLSNAIPEELYNACQNAVKSGKVKVPRGFKFTMDDVKAWINHASACL
jgi:NADPH:quinone reductase-like Zn-dependent oxidoreductase